MNDGSILYLPIQINGDGRSKPTSLKDRELYVLDNGTLYVGKKQTDGTISIMEVAGRVVDNATIKNATLSGSITLGEGIVYNGGPGKLIFVDDGTFPRDELPNGDDTLLRAFGHIVNENLVDRVSVLEQGGTGGSSGSSGSSGVPGTVVNKILSAGTEEKTSD